MRSRFWSGSIRTRIFLAFLFPILPMMAVVLINYFPARQHALENGLRLMALSSASSSEEFDTFFNARRILFESWTEVDIFGMAIEFDTLDEATSHFGELMKLHPEFLLLTLTDTSGIVLSAAGNTRLSPGQVANLTGRALEDWPESQGTGRQVLMVPRQMPGIQAGPGLTCRYSFRTADSTGQANGFFIAYLDGTVLDTMLEELRSEMVQSGFANTSAALLNVRDRAVVTQAGPPFHPEAEDTVFSPGRLEKGGTPVKVAMEKGAAHVISSGIRISYRPGAAAGEAVDCVLGVSVPETDILSRIWRILKLAILVAGIGGLVFFVICLFMAQSISRPIRGLADVLEAYGNGDRDVRADTGGNDEIGYLARRFNAMLEEINRSAGELRASESKYRFLFNDLQDAINTGSYSFRFRDLQDDDELGASLNRMLETLEKADLESRSQAWLKTGQAELRDIITGERDLTELCRNAITFISRYVDARVGTCFIRIPETGSFSLRASYAFRERKGAVNTFREGEGLAGQAALEKDLLIFSDVPEGYLTVESSLGTARPTQILVLPLVYEDQVYGVMELGVISPLTDLHIDFIELAGAALAVSVSGAQFNQRLQTLVDKTREQAEELKEQQEELKATNEELGDQTAMLEEQTAVLRESEAKLQRHQERLETSNRELEEKTRLLEFQKAEIEKTNQSLTEKQKEIEEKALQLERATAYKSQFLANMSHELRTPLNSMLLLAKILNENSEGNLTPDQVDSLASIHRSGRNLLHLINDILDLSKIEADKIELSIGPVSIRSFLKEIQAEFNPVAEDKSLGFRTQADTKLPDVFSTDVHRLGQVIRNIVGNALKFTDQGTVTLNVSPGNDKNKTVVFSVSDTGPGIPESQVQAIFDAFKQVDGSISRRHGGTGLGLSISKKLARLLGGELSVESRPGKGSTFSLTLPLSTDKDGGLTGTVPTEPEAQPPVLPDGGGLTVPGTLIGPGSDSERSKSRTHRSEGVLSNSTPGPKSLLIIEDDPVFSGLIADFFKKNGYATTIAADGETGIRSIIHEQPSAVILDIGLPGIDGWAVLDELKNNPSTRHIPVHIISAYDESRQGLEKGAAGYLIKPVSPDDLRTVLRRIDGILGRALREILIIDHDSSHQERISRLFETGDINVSAAATGQEALKLLAARPFDCMILDPDLSDMTGFMFLDRAREMPGHEKIPVIVHTDRKLSDAEREYIETYQSRFILKNAASLERLLDETALFLHRMEHEIPEDQRKLIQHVRDRESVLSGKTVMVVDDDMRNAFALRKFLKSRGMNVVIANNGKRALELLEKEEIPDIILMDIMMPVLDGFETMVLIRKQKRFRNLPILAVTAHAMETDRDACIRCGANDYMTKPVDPQQLLTMLRVWLY